MFSFGGIGATPDDHTRACAAAAAGVDLLLHPDAEAEIRGRFGADTTPNRLKMGEFPRGADIIPNPYNRIRGFSLGEHHFVPGFPIMAWPMVEWVLDNRYAHLFHRQPEAEASIMVYDSAESTLMPLMEAVEANYRGLKVFSLPSVGEGGQRRHIELGVRGAPDEVAPALEELKRGVTETGGNWEAQPCLPVPLRTDYLIASFFVSAPAFFGRVSLSTPSLYSASDLVSSMSWARVKLRNCLP